MTSINALETVEHMDGMIDSAMESIDLAKMNLTPAQIMLIRSEMVNMFVGGYVRRQEEARKANQELNKSISDMKETIEELAQSFGVKL